MASLPTTRRSPAAPGLPHVRHRDADARGLPVPAPDRPDALAGLSIVLVSRDDATTAASALTSAARAAAAASVDYEIVAVDDGSSDQTAERIARFCRPGGRVRLLVHPEPTGTGAALRAGIEASSMAWVLLIDGSTELDPQALDDFLPLAAGHDLLLGWRVMRGAPLATRVRAAVWNRLVRRALGVSVRDIDCPVRLVRRELLDRAELPSAGGMVGAELVAEAKRLDARVAEVQLRQRGWPAPWGRSIGSPGQSVLALPALVRLHHRTRDGPGHRIARGVLGVAVAAVAVAGGVGWLYQLRRAGVLGLGPHLGGALPLQQLAGDDAQPAIRMAVAWLPAGAVAAFGLGTLGRLPRPLLTTALIGVALLVTAGAESDAIATSLSVTGRVLPQLARPGLWAAIALLTIGAAFVTRPGSGSKR